MGVIARRIRSVLALLSGTLCLGISVLAVRAQFGGNDYLEWKSNAGPIPEVTLTVNELGEEKVTGMEAYEQWDRWQWKFHIRANPNGIFCFGRQPFYGYPRNSFDWHLPYFVAIPCTMILPAIVLRGYKKERRRRKRRERGLCLNCGYDLRASKDRCPECGMAIPGERLKAEG